MNQIAPVFLPLHLEENFDGNGLFPIVTHPGCANSAACVGYSKDIQHGRLFAAAPDILALARELQEAIDRYLESTGGVCGVEPVRRALIAKQREIEEVIQKAEGR
jgi:hypothetical protein